MARVVYTRWPEAVGTGLGSKAFGDPQGTSELSLLLRITQNITIVLAFSSKVEMGVEFLKS